MILSLGYWQTSEIAQGSNKSQGTKVVFQFHNQKLEQQAARWQDHMILIKKIVLELGRSGLLLLLVLVQVVLLGKLQVPQELGVAALHARMPLDGRLLHSTTVVLPGLVMSSVILGLGHGAPGLETDLLANFRF